MPVQLSPSFIILGGSAAAGALAIYAYVTYRRNLRAVGEVPGLRTCVSITRPIMAVLPPGKIPYSHWYFSIGLDAWASKHYDLFREYGQDIISAACLTGQLSIDLDGPSIVVADADASQEIMGSRARFRKPIELYTVLDLYGRNVLTAGNEEWRVHRKITAPTFSEKNNKLVCEETILVMEGLFDIWKGNPVVQTNFTEITVALALMVICGAGFGKRVPWVDTAPPAGHQLTFKGAIEIVSSDLFIKVVIPDFAMGLTKRTSRVQLGFEELHKYMREMIHDRSKSYRDCSDLFSNLIAANENDSEGLRLTDEELVGNIFIFLIAGYETTAHTLAFAVGLLALYPEVQEKLYRHVVETVADPTGSPMYHEVAALTFVTAVFYETLRLYPSVTLIPKRSTEDTTLRTENIKGEPVVVPVPKGCLVNVIVPALHRNRKVLPVKSCAITNVPLARYWKDPGEFQPERFLGDWPKAAFVPFAAGARACMGRRFAEVEATVALSMLVRNYRIEIQVDPRFAGETFEERRSRVLAFRNILSLTPKHIPVTLTRR